MCGYQSGGERSSYELGDCGYIYTIDTMYKIEGLYCHTAYLTYMQSTWCEMPRCMKQSWNQDCHQKYQ